jgi:hypothetical protein
MSNIRTDLNTLFEEEEKKAREIFLQEEAAYAALPQAEKDRINAEREARMEAMAADLEAAGDDEEDDDEDDDDEDDEDETDGEVV